MLLFSPTFDLLQLRDLKMNSESKQILKMERGRLIFHPTWTFLLYVFLLIVNDINEERILCKAAINVLRK